MEFKHLDLNKREEVERVLRHYFNLFPERVETFAKNHWQLTQELEEWGKKIREGSFTDLSIYVLFLLKIAAWKNPHNGELMKSLRNVVDNNPYEIKFTIDKSVKFLDILKDEYSQETEIELIDLIGNLKGFGRGTKSRKMVSAVLRFLCPDFYGTVDYRNWAILSNTGGRYFKEKLLEPLADDLDRSSKKDINTGQYIEYLKIIRKLAERCNMTPAEVDMALFSFSHDIKPLVLKFDPNKEKAFAILSIIEEIVEDASTCTPNWVRERAQGLYNRMRSMAERGEFEKMYRECKKLMSKGSNVANYLTKHGKKSIESEFHRIESIYREFQ
ncbi:hypothetical protein DRP07_08070 [Archaeoglobales archaeon]|nr:MAG: hypothetical protein DRP07_08070 [Archaeoglobales archaeon]